MITFAYMTEMQSSLIWGVRGVVHYTSLSKHFSDPIDKNISCQTLLVGDTKAVNEMVPLIRSVYTCTVVLFGGSGGWLVIPAFLSIFLTLLIKHFLSDTYGR